MRQRADNKDFSQVLFDLTKEQENIVQMCIDVPGSDEDGALLLSMQHGWSAAEALEFIRAAKQRFKKKK